MYHMYMFMHVGVCTWTLKDDLELDNLSEVSPTPLNVELQVVDGG